LEDSVRLFLLDRQAARATAKTIQTYSYVLNSFSEWLLSHGVSDVSHMLAQHIRAYLVHLQEKGHKDTTQHCHARVIRTWCNWLVAEGDLAQSPMARVKMPRLEQRIPPPFSRDDIVALLGACNRHDPMGARNQAIILCLLDSGLRAEEFVKLQIGDVNMTTGLVTVLGKGHKQRTVRLGAKARAAIRRMLAFRRNTGPNEPLWTVHFEQGALTLHGLQIMLHRLGERAGVVPCSPHRFRRTFALWCLRAGMNLHDLRLLMGHSQVSILARYLALGGEDVERVHEKYSPVDRGFQGRDYSGKV
jgi:site-specific recombinase XerD